MELPEAVTSFLDGGLEFVYSLGKYVEPTVVLGKCLNGNGRMR